MRQLFAGILLVCITNIFVQSEVPVGHLKPFGHHRPPSVVVDEYTVSMKTERGDFVIWLFGCLIFDTTFRKAQAYLMANKEASVLKRENAPTPKEFFDKYVSVSKPVIFRGGVSDSKAYQLWTDDYVRANFGEMEVRLEGKKEKKHIPPLGETYIGRDTLRHFIDTYHNQGNNVYIVSDLPSVMYKDMGVVPSFGACGEMSRRIVEVDIWWSGGGSSSIIHKDAFNQMNCLLNGTKYWKLIEYKYEKDIYKHPEPDYEIGGFSDVNPEKVNLKKHPKVANVEWSNITIYAGDCLFLPKSYYHQVNSDGTNNKAVSLLFARFDDNKPLNFSDCNDNVDYKSMKSLANFDVQWKWPGKGVMVMGRSDLEEGLRSMFLAMTEEAEESNNKIDMELWIEKSAALLEGGNVELDKLKDAFRIMDKDGDGILTPKNIQDLTIEELRNAADQIERYEPSNAYEFEYSIIPFENVWFLAKMCMKRYDTLTKDIWLKHYAKTGGSPQFGGEIFTKLADGKTEVKSADVTDEKILFALENWVKYWAPQYSSLREKPSKLSLIRKWEAAARGKPVNDDTQDEPDDEEDPYDEPDDEEDSYDEESSESYERDEL